MIASLKGFGNRTQLNGPRHGYTAGSGWIAEQAESRGITLSSVLSNFEWVEGDKAIEILTEHAVSELQRVNSYVTMPVKRLLARYSHAAQGGIVAYGSTLDGGRGEVAYFKPIQPRVDFEKRKAVKYETPPRQPATPLLPWVKWEHGLKIANRFGLGAEYRQRLQDDNGVSQGIDRGFYRWLQQHSSIPVAITEGLFKAIALIEHGIPAIALRGIDCGFKKGTTNLHDQIGHFLTPGRKFCLFFDQDSKPKTVANVCRAILKTGKAIEVQDCSVKIALWDGKRGKGIDDYLVNFGEHSQQAFDNVLSGSATLEEWRKGQYNDYLFRVQKELQSSGVNPERRTEGGFVPELPHLRNGAIHAISANQGSGKTERIGQDCIEYARNNGWFIVTLVPTVALGAGAARRWNLPHLNDIDTGKRDQWMVLEHQVNEARGIVACPNSLHRIQRLIPADTPLLIVFDEVNQVCKELAYGQTLKNRQAEILELLTQNLKQAVSNGAIVMAEAGVYSRSIKLIQKLSGCSDVRMIEHGGSVAPYDCTLMTTVPSGYAAYFRSSLAQGKKLILVTSSRNQGRKFDRLAQKIGKVVMRIDSETNRNGAYSRFFDNPDKYLSSLPELPDVLILSPSVGSGASITIPGFDQVHGLFMCLTAAKWFQHLGRYRLPVPRIVAVPRRVINDSNYERLMSAKRVRSELSKAIDGYQRVFDCAIDDSASVEAAELALTISDAVREFYSEDVTVDGVQKMFPVRCLADLLQEAGHSVKCITEPGDKEVSTELKEIQQSLWREDAEAYAKANPCDMTEKEAIQALNSSETSLELELAARKVLWRAEFPGIDFDDPDDCYAALAENFGSLRRGVLLQANAMNLQSCKVAESERVAAILKSTVKLPQKLPQSFFKAALVREVGLLELLDGNPYCESDDRVVKIKAQAMHYADEIARYFLINVKTTQTGVEIANKLLKRLALKAECIKQQGSRGSQVRIWGITNLCDPVRVRLLQAAFRRVDGDESKILTEFPEAFHRLIQDQSQAPQSECDFENDFEFEIQYPIHNGFDSADGGWTWEVDESDD